MRWHTTGTGISYLWPKYIENCTGYYRNREEEEEGNRSEPCDGRLGRSGELTSPVVLFENTKGVQKSNGAEKRGKCAEDDEPRSGAVLFQRSFQVPTGNPRTCILLVGPLLPTLFRSL